MINVRQEIAYHLYITTDRDKKQIIISLYSQYAMKIRFQLIACVTINFFLKKTAFYCKTWDYCAALSYDRWNKAIISTVPAFPTNLKFLIQDGGSIFIYSNINFDIMYVSFITSNERDPEFSPSPLLHVCLGADDFFLCKYCLKSIHLF